MSIQQSQSPISAQETGVDKACFGFNISVVLVARLFVAKGDVQRTWATSFPHQDPDTWF